METDEIVKIIYLHFVYFIPNVLFPLFRNKHKHKCYSVKYKHKSYSTAQSKIQFTKNYSDFTPFIDKQN